LPSRAASSFQAWSQELNDYLSRTRTFDLKRRLAAQIKTHQFPMVMNCVVHRNHGLVLRAIAAGGDGAAPPLLFRSQENSRLSESVAAVALPEWTGARQKGVTLTFAMTANRGARAS